MSATTAADLLLEVKQARPWDRARLVKEYSATHPNELPVETLSLILNDVSVTAKGNTVIDAIPAVLRSGSDPYTACCELEAMVEVCDAVTLMPARPRNRHARTPARLRNRHARTPAQPTRPHARWRPRPDLHRRRRGVGRRLPLPRMAAGRGYCLELD